MHSNRGIAIAAALTLGWGVALAALLGPSTALASGIVAQTPRPGSETRTSTDGQVTIAVALRDTRPDVVFAVTMDTHAVNLDGYDLAQVAVLRVNQGQETRPSAWVAPPGGHHREGTLTFPGTAADGGPLLGPSVGAIELVIRDVAGVPERVFRWTE